MNEIAETMGSCHRERKYGPRGKWEMMELYVRRVSKKCSFLRRCSKYEPTYSSERSTRHRFPVMTVRDAKPQAGAALLKTSLKFSTSENHVGNLGDRQQLC
jgi:hypothetical protein